MGYDYSKRFLSENAETMNQLTELYNSQGVIGIPFTDPQQLNVVRYKVSNVLASMALNFPDQFKDLRDKVRTWTSWDPSKEQWTLYIGAPRHKISGRKPGLLPPAPVAYGPPAQTGAPVERWSKLIDDQDSYEAFVKWVATVGPATVRIEAELADPPDNVEFLEVFRAVGWTPELEGPTTIVLKRRPSA